MRRALAGLSVILGVAVTAQAPPPLLFEGARLIIGDPTPPIDGGAFLVQDGVIRAVGPRGAVAAPAGAVRVDLTGKTVMPAMVNVHVHIGYEGYTSGAPAITRPANVLDHLQRRPSTAPRPPRRWAPARPSRCCSSSPISAAGKLPLGGAAALHARLGAAQRRARRGAARSHQRAARGQRGDDRRPRRAPPSSGWPTQGMRHVKMWVDDRRGTYPKLVARGLPRHRRRGARAAR